MKPDKFDKTLGQNIRFWREDRGYTQEQLATHLRMTRVSISNIEHGRQQTSLRNLISICHFLALDLSVIIPMEQYNPKAQRRIKKQA